MQMPNLYARTGNISAVRKLKKCPNQNLTPSIQMSWLKNMARIHSGCMKCFLDRLNKVNPGIPKGSRGYTASFENYGDYFLRKPGEASGRNIRLRRKN